MKAAVISYHTCPYEPFGRGFSGGMNVFLREILERLSFMDVAIEVFTRSEGEYFTSQKNENLKVHHIDCGLRGSPTLLNFLEKERRFSGGVLGLLNGSTDMIFSNYWLSAGTSISARFDRGIPVLHMNHTLEKVKEKFSGTRYGSSLLRQSRLFREYSIQKFADLLIYPSEKDFLLSASYYPWVANKGAVVHPGISEEFLDLPDRRDEGRELLGLPEESIVFLSSGRDERTKNFEGLISAFKRIDDERIWLIIAGRGKSIEVDRIVCLPPQSRDSLVTLVDASDCVVVPSFYESFGIFAVESLARGRPVVTAAGSFLGDMTVSFGLGEVFDQKDGVSLKDALVSFIHKRDAYRDRSGAIALKAREFTWERASARFRQLLDRLC